MAWWVIPLLIITSAAISYAISYSMAEDFSSHSEGGKLDDLAVQTSTYGKAIPILYGTIRFAGNVIWSTNIVEHVNRTSQSTGGGKGGGGGSSTATQTTYTQAEQIEDFGEVKDVVKVAICQVSEIIGDGFYEETLI
jgi:hypothetical protein